MRKSLKQYVVAAAILCAASGGGIATARAGSYGTGHYGGGYDAAEVSYVRAPAPYYSSGYVPTAYYGYAPYGYFRSYPVYAGYPGWGSGYHAYPGYRYHRRHYGHRW